MKERTLIYEKDNDSRDIWPSLVPRSFGFSSAEIRLRTSGCTTQGGALPISYAPQTISKAWTNREKHPKWKDCKNIPHQGCVCAQLLSPSRVQPFATLWTHQAALSIGILQARIMEWFATPFSKGSSQPRDQTQVSCTGRYNGSKLHCPGPDSVWRW